MGTARRCPVSDLRLVGRWRTCRDDPGGEHQAEIWASAVFQARPTHPPVRRMGHHRVRDGPIGSWGGGRRDGRGDAGRRMDGAAPVRGEPRAGRDPPGARPVLAVEHGRSHCGGHPGRASPAVAGADAIPPTCREPPHPGGHRVSWAAAYGLLGLMIARDARGLLGTADSRGGRS